MTGRCSRKELIIRIIMKNGKREYEEKVRGAYPIDLDVHSVKM